MVGPFLQIRGRGSACLDVLQSLGRVVQRNAQSLDDICVLVMGIARTILTSRSDAPSRLAEIWDPNHSLVG